MDSQDLTTLASTATALLWAKYGTEIAKDIAKSAASQFGILAKLTGKKASTTVWDRVNWQMAASNYCKRLGELYGTTTVLGKAEPIPLENIFTDAYLLDEPSAFLRFDIQTLLHDPAILNRSHQRTDGVTLVKKESSNRLFILGKPGAGKTTFLKNLVWQATQGNIKKTPIFISLKEWSDSHKELIPFMSKQFDICGFPQADKFVLKILEKGTAIVLFDGLDEVKQEDQQRWETITQLRDFTHKYDKTQCLITCRIAATTYLFDKFRYVEIADFTDEQVQVYVKKWFQEQPEKLIQFFVEFAKADNKNLREMARTPLLLSLLCLTFDSTLTFPKRRVEIYEEAIEALLKKWDSARAIQRDEAYKGLSVGRKRQLFARIAAKTFQANQYFLPERKLTDELVNYLVRLPDSAPPEDIDGVVVLKAIEAQHGIICERANQIYSFAHLTFQEYFAARYIIEDTSGRALRGLINSKNIADPRWREVILLTASLLDDADEYMEEFQQAIDDLIIKDDDICDFLDYIHAKSSTIKSSSNTARVRAFYCCLAFNLIHRDISYESKKITLDLNFLRARAATDIELAQSIEGNNEYAQAIYHTRALIYDLAATLDSRLAHTLDKSLPGLRFRVHNFVRIKGINLAGVTICDSSFNISSALDYEFDNLIKRAQTMGNDFTNVEDREMQIDLHLSYILSHALCHNWWPSTGQKLKQYIDIIKTQALVLGLKKLGNLLASLKIPELKSRRWRQFTDTLQSIILEERMIGRIWTPTRDQCTRLISYFEASILFLEALDVAAVSDRIQIKNNLLVNPKKRNNN